MAQADPGPGPNDAASAAVAALSRVLGIEASVLRGDSPLDALDWDSLARVCWTDAMAESGWLCVADRDAVTVADLVRDCRARDMSA